MFKKEPDQNLVSEALSCHGDATQQTCCQKLKRGVVAEGHKGPSVQCWGRRPVGGDMCSGV